VKEDHDVDIATSTDMIQYWWLCRRHGHSHQYWYDPVFTRLVLNR